MKLLLIAAMFLATIFSAFAQPETTDTVATLWQQFVAFWHSNNFQVLVFALVSGTIGVLAHWWVQFLRKNISENFVEYIFGADTWKNSALTFTLFTGAVTTAVFSGGFDGSSLGAVIMLGFTTGFSADSLANRTGITDAAQVSNTTGTPPTTS